MLSQSFSLIHFSSLRVRALAAQVPFGIRLHKFLCLHRTLILVAIPTVTRSDSVGYEVTIGRLFKSLNLEMTPVTLEYLRRKDRKRAQESGYQKRVDIKARAVADRNRKIREGAVKEGCGPNYITPSKIAPNYQAIKVACNVF